ncbi:MAG: methionine adenosyltransferase [Planctomycetes bacterium]|nr:methionine adenosyltransferase [Planctomycetota bacterium]
MNIVVGPLDGTPAAAQSVEVVERKGLGHPDSICDAIAEEVSLALSRHYLQRFGVVLHHNVDKVLLRGGTSRPAFGGGEVDEPIEIYLAGRATREWRGIAVPVDELAVEAARAWLAAHLHALDVPRHVRVHSLLRSGSADLVELFARQPEGGPRLANDTSLGVGFAPATPLEAAVLRAEHSLRDPTAPERGEDVKVMGVRVAERSTLTVACAFIGRHLRDLDAYLEARREAARTASHAGRTATGSELPVEVNTADDAAAGSVYLTVTGTSAEAGDDGQTGRGNRMSGLITPARPMTLEAIAGKNPITHVGKLYNVVATRIAEALVSGIDGVREANVLMVSRIGTPIDAPQVVHLRLRTDAPQHLAALARPARELARRHVSEIAALWRTLLLHNLATGESGPP